MDGNKLSASGFSPQDKSHNFNMQIDGKEEVAEAWIGGFDFDLILKRITIVELSEDFNRVIFILDSSKKRAKILGVTKILWKFLILIITIIFVVYFDNHKLYVQCLNCFECVKCNIKVVSYNFNCHIVWLWINKRFESF